MTTTLPHDPKVRGLPSSLHGEKCSLNRENPNLFTAKIIDGYAVLPEAWRDEFKEDDWD